MGLDSERRKDRITLLIVEAVGQQTRPRIFDRILINPESQMSIYQRDPRAGAFLGGDRVSGQDIRDQNGEHPFLSHQRRLTHNRIVIAAQSIANVVKSSLGPLGLDKMLVDNIGVRCPQIETSTTSNAK